MEFPRRQIIICLLVNIGQIIIGYAMGWTAPVVPKLQDPNQTPLPGVVSDTEVSWIGSLLYVGCILGPYITGFLSNTAGRKPCLCLAGAVCFLSFLVLALASNLAMVYAGRILKGVGTGILAIMNCVYIGEIASTPIRGILLTCTGIFSTLGTLIIYSVGPYVSYPATGYIGAALSLAHMAGVFFIPETPLFLVMRGRDEKAKEILTILRRPEDIDTVIKSKDDYDAKKANKQWSEIFNIKSNRKALFITLTLHILQQLSGVVAVLFFATTIFDLANSSVDPNIGTIIIGLTQITASCVTPFFVDRTGRRPLMLISTAMCAFSLGVLGTYFYMDYAEISLVDNVKWLPLATLIVFFFSYDLGFGIIPGTFIGEMFTPNVRSSGSIVTVTTSWLVGFGVATAFGYMLALGPYFAFWFYAGACTVALVFSIIFVPETKGKTLAEVQEMLS